MKTVDAYDKVVNDALACIGEVVVAERSNDTEAFAKLKKRYRSLRRKMQTTAKKMHKAHEAAAMGAIDMPDENAAAAVFVLLTTPPEYMGLDDRIEEQTPESAERAIFVHEVYIGHVRIIAEKSADIAGRKPPPGGEL